MRKKSLIAMMAMAMMFVLSLSVLTACGDKKHDFSSEWERDETYHWHACMTKKHTDVADKAEHTFDAGIVTAAPTETETGVLTFTCTVCGYQKTKSIDKVAHVHTFNNNIWEKDDTHHWHPATCAHTDQKESLETHVWNEGVITTAATETSEGVKTYTCTKCGKTKNSTIGKLDHVHTFDTAKWSFDSENHWHPATCAHTDERDSIAPHVWNEGVITTAATETSEGVKTYTCTKCGKTKNSTIGKLDHVHTFDTAKWSFDSENHWHPATCAHTGERDSIAPHNWNDGVVTTPANYGTEGVKTYTCTVCRTTRIEAVPALDAKNNVIAFADGLALDKTYDGEAVILSPEQVLRQGDGAITVMYKEKDANDNTYAATAPTNAGEYTVKAIVEATAEWKGGSITADFTIEKRTVTLPSVEFDGEFAENLASGKLGLACINVAEDTNNVVTWVTICVPEEYYAIGIHTISVDDLFVDNDNFMLATGEYASVRFTVWDAPAFYAGIKDIFSFASGDIVITTEIARGTLHKGDSLHINELGKIIKVTGITKNKVQVDTATAGDAVDLRIEGVKKEELSRGFMLSEPDTVVCYGNFTITIRLYTKDEGGQHTPIFSGITPQAVFDDTFFETICTVTFPEDNTMFFPGETREGVTVDFQGKKLPGFVGRRFKLKSGGKTIAECIITALTPTTNVTGNVIAPEGKTVVIDPIEKDATAFAINLNRSTALAGITETEAVNLLVKCDGKVIGRYSRSGLGKGELPYVENGGTMAGSYIRVNLAKNISALTDADGKWISEKGSVTFEVTVERTEQLGNLNIGTTQTISLQNGETRYYTINNLANLADGWYSFVNCFDSGKCRYEIYTGEYVKDEQMHDMFRSSGGAYVIKYTANKNITDEIIGVNAAKAELSATNATASLTIPTGKKGDRLIIKVTLYKALTYHHSNYVKFEEKVAAFNGSKIKVFKNDYSVFNGREYASLSSGDRFKLPNRNNEQTVAYIMMEYGSDLNSTTTLKFYNQASTATELPEPKTSDTAFREVTFNANAPLHFYFKVSTPGKYRIDIIETDSIVLVPTISTKALYNPVFDAVTVNHTREFTAGSTGWYSLTLQNTLNTSQKVRIRIVKVS